MKYDLHNYIAIVSLDDGKANVVGHNFLDGVNSALDARAFAVAEKLAQLPQKQYAANKLFLRKKVLEEMARGLENMMVQAA